MTDNALDYIIDKWDLDNQQSNPIQIPDSHRIILAKLFKELGYRVGAEIGTLGGAYASKLKRYNLDLTLYCIDSWKVYDGMQNFLGWEKLPKFFNEAQRRLREFSDVHFVRRKSMDAVKDFADNSLDFVHIDANHELPYITEDIFYWSEKVRPGGIVSGHDYHKKGQGQPSNWTCGVRGAVHAYTDIYNIDPWFVMDKCTLDRAGSFLWVKP